MKILVTGSKGQLAKSIHKYQNDIVADWYFYDRSKLDITNKVQVQKLLEKISPDYFINCAAYTAVDLAESNEDEAYKINATSLDHICDACNKSSTRMIHISTDYVYHHNPGRPLRETDETKPRGVYAQSKLAGENVIQRKLEDHYIIRTSWVYSEYGKNFVKTMLALSEDRKELNIVSDQLGSPTYASDLAKIIIKIILDSEKDRSKTPKPGIYNFSNSGVTNWAEFAEQIFKATNNSCKVIPVNSSDYVTAAKRPKWSVMNKEKIQSELSIKLNPWEESLLKCLEALGEAI